MKYYKISLIIIMSFLLAGCESISALPNGNKSIASDSGEIIMMRNAGTSDYFSKQKEEYYNYVIDTINSSDFVKNAGADDNSDVLDYALAQCVCASDESLGNGKIIPIAQNPDNGLYVAEFDYDGWQVELLLISFEKGKILFIKELGEALGQSASLVCLKGFSSRLIQTYTASNMGNGCMKLITCDEDARLIGEFHAVDFHAEASINPSIIKQYRLEDDELTSYVFGDIDDENYGGLRPEYIDINGDGFDDIQFAGVQTLIGRKAGEISRAEVKSVYIYDRRNEIFVLSETSSILPDMRMNER